MVTITIKCPNCKKHIEINGKIGETKLITCPNCNNKGKFTIKEDKLSKDKKFENSIIKVNNLSKIYNGVKVVNNISFEVKKGEIFGFLGPNGAGKTTSIKSILGLIQINSGNILINNFSIKDQEKKAKENIGYLPEKVAFYNNLTAIQNLHFYAEMKGVSKDECIKLIDEFGLSESINKKVGKFSKGMTQRLGMIRAILGNPSILILDEPSGGLDPRGILQIRNKIKKLKKLGLTIFISSHNLSEIQEICDRVGIINKGNIVAKDSVSALSKKLNLKPKMTIELEKITEKIKESIKDIIDKEDEIDFVENNVDVICDSKTKAKVILAIAKAGGNILNLKTLEPSLEEVFMRFTQEQI